MRQRQYTRTRAHVHAHATDLLTRHLRLRDFGRCCPAAVLLTVLLAACAYVRSLAAACARLRDAPCAETARQALLATLPGYAELQRRVNRALQADLPKALRRRRQPLAIDLILIPYYGQPEGDAARLLEGQGATKVSHFFRRRRPVGQWDEKNIDNQW